LCAVATFERLIIGAQDALPSCSTPFQSEDPALLFSHDPLPDDIDVSEDFGAPTNGVDTDYDLSSGPASARWCSVLRKNKVSDVQRPAASFPSDEVGTSTT
jgi:hypothetical protein